MKDWVKRIFEDYDFKRPSSKLKRRVYEMSEGFSDPMRVRRALDMIVEEMADHYIGKLKNPVRIPEKVLTWRESKRKGSIMRPKTFKAIRRKAARGGYAIPSAVGGKAYWITVLNKYLDEHPGDRIAMKALRQLLKGRRRGPIRRNPTIEYPSSFRKLKLKIKRNPVKKWYVGQKIRGKAEVFSSSVNPTKKTHGYLYKYASGPFKTKSEAESWARNLWVGR